MMKKKKFGFQISWVFLNNYCVRLLKLSKSLYIETVLEHLCTVIVGVKKLFEKNVPFCGANVNQH